MAGLEDYIVPGLGLLSAAPKLYQAFAQNQAANRVKKQDSTTAGEREQLAMSRQAAATAQMPGLGMQQNRLGQIQNGVLQNARLGAGSGSDLLAASAAAAAQRQQGELQLGVQGLRYQDQGRQQLRQDLSAQSARQQRDLDNYNREKAALRQGAAENLNNAVGTVASYGALAYNMYQDKNRPQDPGATSRIGTSGSFGLPSMQYVDPETSTLSPGTATPAQLGIPQNPSLDPLHNYGLNGFGSDRYRYGLGGGRYANRSQRYGF